MRVNRLLLNNIDVRGVGWGAFAFMRPGFISQQWASISRLIETARFTPPIGAEFPEQVGDAIAELGARRAIGRRSLPCADAAFLHVARQSRRPSPPQCGRAATRSRAVCVTLRHAERASDSRIP